MTSSFSLRFWAEWFNSGRSGREIGNPTRSFANNQHTFIDWVRMNERNGTESYCSVQPFNRYGNPICLEKIFFDFDNKTDHKIAIEDALDFSRRIRKFYNADAFTVFSGNKGAHSYIYFEKPIGYGLELESMNKICEKIMLMLYGNANYESLDNQIKGNAKQLSRVPYSHHHVSGKLVCPINDGGEILTLPIGVIDQLKSNGLKYSIYKKANENVVLDIEEKKRLKSKVRNPSRKYKHSIRPCIREILKSSSIHSPAHKLKVATVAELSAEGWTLPRIVSAFSGMSGFDNGKTTRQVSQILKVKYSPFTCSTIIGYGGCLGSSCPTYRKRRAKK